MVANISEFYSSRAMLVDNGLRISDESLVPLMQSSSLVHTQISAKRKNTVEHLYKRLRNGGCLNENTHHISGPINEASGPFKIQNLAPRYICIGEEERMSSFINSY